MEFISRKEMLDLMGPNLPKPTYETKEAPNLVAKCVKK